MHSAVPVRFYTTCVLNLAVICLGFEKEHINCESGNRTIFQTDTHFYWNSLTLYSVLK